MIARYVATGSACFVLATSVAQAQTVRDAAMTLITEWTTIAADSPRACGNLKQLRAIVTTLDCLASRHPLELDPQTDLKTRLQATEIACIGPTPRGSGSYTRTSGPRGPGGVTGHPRQLFFGLNDPLSGASVKGLVDKDEAFAAFLKAMEDVGGKPPDPTTIPRLHEIYGAQLEKAKPKN